MPLNPLDKPANLRTAANRRVTMPNPLDGMEDHGRICDNAALELSIVLRTMREADDGAHRGPFGVNSTHWTCICFESTDQREAFRTALCLTHHGVQYWTAEAFLGSLGLLKRGDLGGRAFAKRDNPFGVRDNPFAKAAPANSREAKAAENANKYSELRAEAKRTAEKLKRYTEDGTWIALCACDEDELATVYTALGLAPSKWLHIHDILDNLSAQGIEIDVPRVGFGLRATARPDKVLNSLVG